MTSSGRYLCTSNWHSLELIFYKAENKIKFLEENDLLRRQIILQILREYLQSAGSLPSFFFWMITRLIPPIFIEQFLWNVENFWMDKRFRTLLVWLACSFFNYFVYRLLICRQLNLKIVEIPFNFGIDMVHSISNRYVGHVRLLSSMKSTWIFNFWICGTILKIRIDFNLRRTEKVKSFYSTSKIHNVSLNISNWTKIEGFSYRSKNSKFFKIIFHLFIRCCIIITIWSDCKYAQRLDSLIASYWEPLRSTLIDISMAY